MKSRKQIRKEMQRQKRSSLYRKSAATTTALVSTMNLLPVGVLAASVDESNDTTVQVVDQPTVATTSTVDSSDSAESQEESQKIESPAAESDSSIKDNTSESESITTPSTEDSTTSSISGETNAPEASDLPMLTEAERIALETKIMPNVDRMMARSNTQQAFIQQVGPMAQQVASVNDLYASVMIAQAILESGWGQSTLTTQANNMFGIKGSYNGQYVEMRTMEDDGKGNLYEIVAKFRKYPSLKESFEDNAHVLKTTSFSAGVYFYSGAWKSNTSSYRDATQWLQGRYATDTTYASKLNNLIETYNLTQFDSATGGGSGNGNTSNNAEQSINKQFKTTAALNIRSDASTSASVVGSLANNTTFKAVAQKQGTSVNGNSTWYRVEGKGWVSGAYVKEVGSNNNSNNSNNSEQTINKQFKTTAVLNIRSNASTTASVVGSLANNATFKAVAQKQGTNVNGNSTWYRVEGKGWVSGAYVKEVSSASSTKTYTVKSGDTLWGISQKYGVSINQLMQWNNISGSLIFVGQRLIVSK
ncbi:glucosaminidase domain-containing protein [Enterococcus sp.]|uniref:glucosaminidase domain-containing protein n=1 Tax=Enterococcus sp. TaxID=35783 RepID=UPI0025C1589B|nr:glucosaminidase domain-containing protein [Enterococcus sp.]